MKPGTPTKTSLLVRHASDIHGDLRTLSAENVLPLPMSPTAEASEQFDAWVLTGDMFPNFFRRGNSSMEHLQQEHWFQTNLSTWFRVLGGKPVITVDGNHDWASLGGLLEKYGYVGPVHRIGQTQGEVVDFGGLKWTGYREIPIIDGRWVGESTVLELNELANAACNTGADVLVTHCPPANILANAFGCGALLNNLAYNTNHRFRYHLFGHIHECAGVMETFGIKFINSATLCREVELTLLDENEHRSQQQNEKNEDVETVDQ